MKKMNFKKGVLTLFISTTLMTLLFFTGCQNEEDVVNNEELPFLSFNESIDYSCLSLDDQRIIDLAFRRLEFSIENGLFKLKQKSGSEIRVSEDLFHFFEMVVKNSNDCIEFDEIDLSIAKTRSNSESEGSSGQSDCVALTILNVIQQFGGTTSYTEVSGKVDAMCGGDGVRVDEVNSVLNVFFYATEVPIPTNTPWPVKTSIAILREGHAVTLLSVTDNYAICWDEQQSRHRMVMVTEIYSVYRVDGLR